MRIRLCILIYILMKCPRIAGSRFESFRKTQIIMNDCDSTVIIEQEMETSKIQCALSCLSADECRRYLYCSSTNKCTLYKDGTDCIMSEDTNGCSCFKKVIACNQTDCTCPLGFYGDSCQNIFTDCTDGILKGAAAFEEYLVTIQPTVSDTPFEVLCLLNYGGWTTILDRSTKCRHENFNRSLAEYEKGFGYVHLNSWIGFDKVLQIMENPNSGFKLNIVMYYNTAWEYCETYYPSFTLVKASGRYEIYGSSTYNPSVSQCGDTIFGDKPLTGNSFSTYDVDYTNNYACANKFGGGWWFDADDDCSKGFLMGSMDGSGTDNFWINNTGNIHIQRAQMRIQRIP